MLVLPDFDDDGLLPPGIHCASWDEVEARFGATSHRRRLLAGLLAALVALSDAGCRITYLDGSFVTSKETPNDYDLCWEMDQVDLDRLDPVFLDLDPPRAAQKAKFRGDLLPNVTEGSSRSPFLDFFQIDKETGKPRGIVALDLRRLPR